jgi:hypothetical protein
MDEKFIVGGVEMDRPGDGPADQTVNCRCSIYFKRVKATANDTGGEGKVIALAGVRDFKSVREFMRVLV